MDKKVKEELRKLEARVKELEESREQLEKEKSNANQVQVIALVTTLLELTAAIAVIVEAIVD